MMHPMKQRRSTVIKLSTMLTILRQAPVAVDWVNNGPYTVVKMNLGKVKLKLSSFDLFGYCRLTIVSLCCTNLFQSFTYWQYALTSNNRPMGWKWLFSYDVRETLVWFVSNSKPSSSTKAPYATSQWGTILNTPLRSWVPMSHLKTVRRASSSLYLQATKSHRYCRKVIHEWSGLRVCMCVFGGGGWRDMRMLREEMGGKIAGCLECLRALYTYQHPDKVG